MKTVTRPSAVFALVSGPWRSARTFATTSDPDFHDRQEQGGDACIDVSAPISLQVRAGLGPAAVHGRSSGTFLASEGTSSICPGHDACFVLVGVVPNSAFRGVCVEAEEVVETVLGGVHLGEHAAGSGAPRSPW